jgi:hypothetical protein
MSIPPLCHLVAAELALSFDTHNKRDVARVLSTCNNDVIYSFFYHTRHIEIEEVYSFYLELCGTGRIRGSVVQYLGEVLCNRIPRDSRVHPLAILTPKQNISIQCVFESNDKRLPFEFFVVTYESGCYRLVVYGMCGSDFYKLGVINKVESRGDDFSIGYSIGTMDVVIFKNPGFLFRLSLRDDVSWLQVERVKVLIQELPLRLKHSHDQVFYSKTEIIDFHNFTTDTTLKTDENIKSYARTRGGLYDVVYCRNNIFLVGMSMKDILIVPIGKGVTSIVELSTLGIRIRSDEGEYVGFKCSEYRSCRKDGDGIIISFQNGGVILLNNARNGTFDYVTVSTPKGGMGVLKVPNTVSVDRLVAISLEDKSFTHITEENSMFERKDIELGYDVFNLFDKCEFKHTGGFLCVYNRRNALFFSISSSIKRCWSYSHRLAILLVGGYTVQRTKKTICYEDKKTKIFNYKLGGEYKRSNFLISETRAFVRVHFPLYFKTKPKRKRLL